MGAPTWKQDKSGPDHPYNRMQTADRMTGKGNISTLQFQQGKLQESRNDLSGSEGAQRRPTWKGQYMYSEELRVSGELSRK